MDDEQEHYRPEQTGMYELEFPAPQLSLPDGRGPVMIHLDGGATAPQSVRIDVSGIDTLYGTVDPAKGY